MLLREMYDMEDTELAVCPNLMCEYSTNIMIGEVPEDHICPEHDVPLVTEADKDLIAQADDNEEDLYHSQGY